MKSPKLTLEEILLEFWLKMDSFVRNEHLEGEEWQVMRDSAYVEAEVKIRALFEDD